MTSGEALSQSVEIAERTTNPTAAGYRRLAVLREQESQRAMAYLGVDRSHVTFLGFPDDGLCQLASTHRTARSSPLTSPYTHRAKPPATEQVVEKVTYRGSDVRRELERVVGDFQPALVVFPDAMDQHPDHCSTSLFTTEAVRRAAEARDTPLPRVLRYLVHYGQWPLGPYGAASARLLSPFDLPGFGRWRTLTLAAEESAGKRQALLSYATQVRIMKPFLVGSARHNELYLEGEPTSSTPCWCQGEGEPVPVERARSRMARGSAPARP